MVGEDRQSNGGAAICSGGIVELGGDAANGAVAEVGNGTAADGNSAIPSCGGFRTYKRRRHSNLGGSDTRWLEDEKVAAKAIYPLPEKATEVPNGVLHSSSSEQFSSLRMDLHTIGSDTCPLNRCRRIVLEQIYKSICESEYGLQGCIQDALQFHPESSCGTAAKESVHSCNQNHNWPSQTEFAVNGSHDASKGNVGVISGGLLSESNCTNADLCQRVFFDILMSENFARLCRLLLENFQGIKVDSVLDFSLANSRMKEGAYERSPILFRSDMQRIWTKLQKLGAEMVVLGKSLSEKLRTSYCQQFLSGDLHTKPEQTEAGGAYTVCACQCCGESADGRDCLVCDSCEEMYHVSCIEPAVKEIPSKSWYCVKCKANGVELPHDSCVVCEKLNASRPLTNDPLNEETFAELGENSNGLAEENGLQLLKGGRNLHRCNICRSEIDNGENFRACSHPFCPHKYYHRRCLTRKQLSVHGPCWYCPSCLCRSCLTDRDDEKIVLCDGCDNAYHIYCLRPPRTSIPRGKWFCRKCTVGIKRIRKVKREYENIQNKMKKRGEGGRIENLGDEGKKNDELIDKSGGVDMLLTAAKTLNYEEKMAAIENKC